MVRARLLVYSHVKWLGMKDMFRRARYDLPGKMKWFLLTIS
jgi:hypothetical protein